MMDCYFYGGDVGVSLFRTALPYLSCNSIDLRLVDVDEWITP